MLTIILIAVGLAMDCFAVSVSSGVCNKSLKIKDSLKISFFFGFFQGLMPLIGFFLGFSLKNYISNIDHWIAFLILSVIGIKMIVESFKSNECETNRFDFKSLYVLLSLSVATSIDALIVGMTFAFIEIHILIAVLIIAIITFIISLSGIYIGKKFGLFFSNKAEFVGGTILIAIGSKILLEHLKII